MPAVCVYRVYLRRWQSVETSPLRALLARGTGGIFGGVLDRTRQVKTNTRVK